MSEQPEPPESDEPSALSDPQQPSEPQEPQAPAESSGLSDVRVLRLVLYAPTQEPVLLLGETDGERCLPVFLRRPQAEVVSVGQRGEKDPPQVQDVLGPVLAALGQRLEGVRITDLVDNVYRAELVLDDDLTVAVRVSDALAIAVREGLPIAVATALLDRVGQPISDLFPQGAEAPPQQQLQEFRSFLDDVRPEDFDR